ncbi:phosphonate ABC transporter, permease protein PhnE [Hoeflea sp. CAU 1731]
MAVSDTLDNVGFGRKEEIEQLFRRKRLLSFGLPVAILLYLVYIFFAFDIASLSDRFRLDNAATLVSDAYSYKTHVTLDNRTDSFSFAIEGEKKGAYPAGETPDWVTIDGDQATVDLLGGYSVVINKNHAVFTVPGYGEIDARVAGRSIETTLPGDEVPDWINASRTRLAVTTPNGRMSVTRSKIEVFRYFYGWELFWFSLDSPFYGMGPMELLSTAFSSDRLVEGKSNIAAMVDDFLYNPMWRHAEVFWAIFETILMAFLGTMGAAMMALPLAFLSASNFTPLQTIRFGFRRLFDLLRGTDALIWTIVLARAFGPGPLTGSLAILLTDTGTFGKMFSEALENVDDKQIEGVRSTGAKPLQRYRFGVIPQIVPVLISQILYYLESNTRSATIIGAIVGGGIGLMLTQAINTQKDWEEVTYYIVLIILMVMIMDTVSGWLRKRLIGGNGG